MEKYCEFKNDTWKDFFKPSSEGGFWDLLSFCIKAFCIMTIFFYWQTFFMTKLLYNKEFQKFAFEEFCLK